MTINLTLKEKTLYFGNFKFTEKLQRQHSEFLHGIYPVSLNVNISSNFGTLKKSM